MVTVHVLGVSSEGFEGLGVSCVWFEVFDQCWFLRSLSKDR